MSELLRIGGDLADAVFVTVPCIRRVSQMQQYSGYHADDDKEELVRFDADELLGDASNEENDEWVATHAGTKREVTIYHVSVYASAYYVIVQPATAQ